MFWDHFVRRLYYTFRESLSDDLDAADEIVNHANQRGLLHLGAMDDLSILLLVLICPRDSPFRLQVDHEFHQRPLRLQLGRVGQLLRSEAPPRTDELLALGHGGSPQYQRAIALNLLFHCHLEDLQTFLSRFYLTDPVTQAQTAVDVLTDALLRYYRFPLGTVDFPCCLYQQFFLFPPVANPPPAALPHPTPTWFTGLDLLEQHFLQACLGLPLAQRTLVYLSFYAKLNVHQITCVLRAYGRMNRHRVVADLLQSWTNLLTVLAQP